MNGFKKVILTTASLVAIATFIAAAPQLTVPQEKHDFGFVPQNAKVSHVFWLRSTGTDTVRIANVVPGCGCTRTPLEKSVLAPGDSTRLEVIFDTRSYSGLVTKRPTIQFSDGSPDQHVSFVCSVMPCPDSSYPIVVSPYKLDLSQSGGKPRSGMKFTISNVGTSDLNLTLSDLYDDLFTVQLPRTLKAGKKAEGALKLTKAGQEAEFEKAFTIVLSDQRNSRFTIPVKRTLPGPGETAPPETKVGAGGR
ncbi:MAG: DUF1573 domain-containing protein [Candidatus Zixiibacteriota bacterium]